MLVYELRHLKFKKFPSIKNHPLAEIFHLLIFHTKLYKNVQIPPTVINLTPASGRYEGNRHRLLENTCVHSVMNYIRLPIGAHIFTSSFETPHYCRIYQICSFAAWAMSVFNHARYFVFSYEQHKKLYKRKNNKLNTIDSEGQTFHIE